MNLGQGLKLVDIPVGTLTGHEWKWLEQSLIMACIQVWTLTGQEFGTGPLNGSSKNTTASWIWVFWTEPLIHSVFCWECSELHVLVSELYVCEGRCSCGVWARLQTSRSSETGHSRVLDSTSCEITLMEGGRERGKEPIGGSRGISGPAHSHTSLSPFCPHRCEETHHYYIVSFPMFIHQFKNL